jgi:acylphosphatase
VEVLAHGAAPAIEELLSWLHRGPRSARVDRVAELTIEIEPPSEPRAAFEIR